MGSPAMTYWVIFCLRWPLHSSLFSSTGLFLAMFAFHGTAKTVKILHLPLPYLLHWIFCWRLWPTNERFPISPLMSSTCVFWCWGTSVLLPTLRLWMWGSSALHSFRILSGLSSHSLSSSSPTLLALVLSSTFKILWKWCQKIDWNVEKWCEVSQKF